MFLQTTEDRIKKLEKRVEKIEKSFNRTLLDINEALVTINDVIKKIGEENEELRKSYKKIEKSKEKLSKELIETGVKKEISDIIEPVKTAVTDNFSFIQEIAKEGTGPSAASLLKLIENNKEVEIREAASKLKVHEIQVEKWVEMLKKQKVINVIEKKNKKYITSAK